MKLTKTYLKQLIKEEIDKMTMDEDLDDFGASGVAAVVGAASLINPLVNLGTTGKIMAVAGVLAPFIQAALFKFAQGYKEPKDKNKNLKENVGQFNLEEFRNQFIQKLNSIAKAKPETKNAIDAEIKAEKNLFEKTRGNVKLYMQEIEKLGKALENYK